MFWVILMLSNFLFLDSTKPQQLPLSSSPGQVSQAPLMGKTRKPVKVLSRPWSKMLLFFKRVIQRR